MAAAFLLVGCSFSPRGITPGDANGAHGGGTSGDGGGMSGDGSGGAPGDGSGGDVPRPSVTTIRVHYPAAGHTLALRGDAGGLSWDTGVPLSAGADDTWTLTLPAVDASLGRALAFKPLLDDATWSRGPNYTVAPGATVDVYPHFFTVHGAVVKLIAPFHSAALGNDRTIWAYLPPSYDENPRARFPVVYMHDGQNLFDPALAYGGHEWQVDETLDAAAEDGSIRELIVIGVENTAARLYEYTPTPDPDYPDGGGADHYLTLLVDELKPRVDALLRTLPDRAHTAILGSSLGGLVSAWAGTRRPDVFGLVGAMSPSTWWNGDAILAAVRAMPAAMRPDRVYVDSGDAGEGDDDVADTNLLAAAYAEIGYVDGVSLRHVVQAGGQHNEIYWAARLPGALQFLIGPR